MGRSVTCPDCRRRKKKRKKVPSSIPNVASFAFLGGSVGTVGISPMALQMNYFLPAAKPLVLERPELLLWWWWGDRIELYIL